jgi:hypothetical protein
MCEVKIAKRGCSSSWTTVLSTSWDVRSFILFCKLLFSWIAYDDFFKIFRRPIIAGWERDMGTIFRPIQILIQICGWRWDHMVDSKKIGSTGSPTLRPKTCGRPVVSQPLGAHHQYRAPSLRSWLPWNNNINNSRRIMISSVKWSWRWDQRWVMIHVQLLFGRTVPRTTSLLLLQLRRYSSLILFFKHLKFVMNIWMNII